MSTIVTPASGGPITDAWGESVADAVNHQFDGMGWLALPVGMHYGTVAANTDTLEAVSNGLAGACIMPIPVPFGMELQRHWVRNMDTGGGEDRSWEVALYVDDGSATFLLVPGSYARAIVSPPAGPAWVSADLEEPLTLRPGFYWQAIRNTSPDMTFGVGALAAGISDSYSLWSEGITPALGANLDPIGTMTGVSGWVRHTALEGLPAQGAGPF